MGRVERNREIARRRVRRVKLSKLRKAYAKSTSQSDKEAMLAKARKISPLISLDESGKD